MAESCGTDKEQTIRGLVEQCRKSQADIDGQLRSSFSRSPEDVEKDCARPCRDNVLDEILDELRELNVTQTQTMELITRHVSPKL